MEELKRWNLTLDNKLVEVKARVLPPESIKSHTKTFDGGVEADWTRHLRALPMFTCAQLRCWIILTPQENIREVKAFTESLFKAGQGMSFILPKPHM